MKSEIEKLFSVYTHLLEKETSFVKIGEYYEITVPFLNNENDFLQIYVQIRKDNVFFKDDGYTWEQLRMNGVSFTPEEKERLVFELQQRGITLNKNELEMVCDKEKFAQGFHQFLQAILWMNGLENKKWIV